MKNYVFCVKDDATKQCSMITSVVDNNERFTVMQLIGVKGSVFERNFPWHQGSVTTVKEVKEWYKKHSLEYDGYEYANGTMTDMSTELKKTLTINPTITGSSVADLIVSTQTTEGTVKDYLKPLTTGVPATMTIMLGYRYKFSLPEGVTWTSGSAPDDIVCSGNATLAANITIPPTEDEE